eukprot:2041385-Alexandrium_andersonii.AAC.1
MRRAWASRQLFASSQAQTPLCIDSTLGPPATRRGHPSAQATRAPQRAAPSGCCRIERRPAVADAPQP